MSPAGILGGFGTLMVVYSIFLVQHRIVFAVVWNVVPALPRQVEWVLRLAGCRDLVALEITQDVAHDGGSVAVEVRACGQRAVLGYGVMYCHTLGDATRKYMLQTTPT